MLSLKIVNYEIYKQNGINGERLLKFLQIVLKDKKNKIIFLDNASSHKNKKVKKFIIKNNFLLFIVFLSI
jgi:transposase